MLKKIILFGLLNIGFMVQGQNNEVATLGGGCFWCIEAVFEQLDGVTKVVSGYSGGFVSNPTYEAVCNGTTGHAEVVQITFEPSVITYKELLTVFFSVHDPTTMNRQGADVGTQYRSVIFYHSSEQQKEARDLINQLSRETIFNSSIVTQLLPFTEFYKAEAYHQDYYKLNQNQRYCQLVISPKMDKFRKEFEAKLKK